MGLLSKYGKTKADILKVNNKLSHAKIFAQIFGVKLPIFKSYIPSNFKFEALPMLNNGKCFVGLNLNAGKRWPAKSMPFKESKDLITKLLNKKSNIYFILLGDKDSLADNKKLINFFKSQYLICIDTSENINNFSYLISKLSLLITSDSLAMHLAISNQIPTIAFFTVTSANEISAASKLIKIKSKASDYCSYSNSINTFSINIDDLIKAYNKLEKNIIWSQS
jgi:heptosyltransferase-2